MTRYFVETEIKLDEMGVDAAHPDAEGVYAGDFNVYFVRAKVVNLDTGKVGEQSLSGIVCVNDEDPYLNECLKNELSEAMAQAGVEL